MPREGVFARVLSRGRIEIGDEMHIEANPSPRPWQAAVITLSDKGAAGLRADESGPFVARQLEENDFIIQETLLLPDDRPRLERQLVRLCDQRQPDLIVTTGGTGFSPRDTTPEATLAVAHRLAPGIAEAIRAVSLAVTPHAMLSRGAAVIRGQTLIVNLPGSVKACREGLAAILPALPHALCLLRGSGGDCGSA